MQEIERRAEEILAAVPAWLWDGRKLPVPVEDIADSCFGLLVREVEHMTAASGAPALAPGQTLSGLLLVDDAEIWVNAREARAWPTRRRFTIGHELGHWVLHRAERTSLFCRHALITGEQRSDVPVLEEQANAFAAALLMPAGLLREAYARDRDFQRLCRRFGASGGAMGRRLHTVIR
jgi:hypothetical protein